MLGEGVSDEILIFLKFKKGSLIAELNLVEKLISERSNTLGIKQYQDKISDEFRMCTCQEAISKVLSENNHPVLPRELARDILRRGYITKANHKAFIYHVLYSMLGRGTVQKQGKGWILKKVDVTTKP